MNTTAQTRTEQLNFLFEEWESSVLDYHGKFVRDGVINETLYNDTTPKILFITKEPNDPSQEKGDFRKAWMDGIKYTFAYRIAEWSYGILNNFPEYDQIWKDHTAPNNAIQQIAFMNIKKSGGGGSSEYHNMMTHLTKIPLISKNKYRYWSLTL
jgi:hypothetical protein